MDEVQFEVDLLCLESMDDDDEFNVYHVHTLPLGNQHEEKRPAIFDDIHYDGPEWDQVKAFQLEVDDIHCVNVPNYACVHSPHMMFSLVDYRSCVGAGLVNDFEHWRTLFSQCIFNPFVHVNDDTPDHYREDLSIVYEHFGPGYICPHKDRGQGKILRTRPICCDTGSRAFCWLDLNITFHRSVYSADFGMPVCLNAPVKGFQVYSLTQHPAFRIREMFHYGKSTMGGEEMLSDIDSYACREVHKATHIMKKLSCIPALWCHTFDFLNPHEKMIFTSMVFDADEDDVDHFMNSLRMYGFSASYFPYSLYHGHIEHDMNDIPSLKKGMNKRLINPRKQMMKYGSMYDIVNTINRHSSRVGVMCEWADILFRLMHSVGRMVSSEYFGLIEDVYRFRHNEPLTDSVEAHRRRHHRYITGLQSVHEVLSMVLNNSRPTVLLRLFDRIVRAHHETIHQGNTLAHVIYEITTDECPIRHDLHAFFQTIDWDFNNFKGISPPSSVGVFLLQLIKVSVIEMSYFEFLMSEFSSSSAFDSSLCGCDKSMLDNALMTTYQIRGMIQRLKQ